MKQTTFFLIVTAAALFTACRPEKPRQACMLAESFTDLKANFANPHATFRSTPLWVWNGKVTKEYIDFALNDLKEHGFGGVFVHPRPGLVNEYLSDEWFDLFKYTVEEAKKIGMDVWIYDENSYPSGFAGGHVPANMPESCNQVASLHKVTLPEIKKEDMDKYAYFFELTPQGYQNITAEVNNYIGKKGDFEAFENVFFEQGQPWHAGFSYVDVLVPGVTDYFLKITIEEGYKRTIGDEFGKTVKGSFTDEPNIAPLGWGQGNVRWTPDLPERFSERFGYNLEDHLPALKEDVGDYKRVRHNYYQILLELFIDRWAKPSFEYYTANNLEFTGHYWEHGWPSPHHGGDNMAMYAWLHRPSIDMLFNLMDKEGDRPFQFGNVRSVKELSSIANQMGYRRTLSETYGGGGWDLTFDDMKRLGDWEYVLGVNTMNQHLTYQTILGSRKYDYPQSFSYHAPYWNQYTLLNDYFGRLSYALSAGEQINDIVIIEPTTTAWLHFKANGEGENDANPLLKRLDISFRKLIEGLETKQIEYDLGSENTMKEFGTVEGNRFIINKRAYKTVIIPEYTESLNEPTVELLNQFLENGGEVIVVGQAPFLIDGIAADYGETWRKATLLNNNATVINQIQNNTITFNTLNAGDGRFYHQRRKLKDGQVLFFANSSKEKKAGASLNMTGKSVLLMDLMDGSIKNYPCVQEAGKVNFQFEVKPSGSMLFFISDSKITGFEDAAILTAGCETVSPQSAVSVKPDYPNALVIEYLTLTFDEKTYKDQPSNYLSNQLFKARGFEHGSAFERAIQFKQEFLEKDKEYKDGSGFVAEYSFLVSDDFDYSGMKAVVEQSYPATVSINGKVVTPIPDEYFIDREFKLFAIGEYVKRGENILKIDAPRMSVFAEIEPIYIYGDFSLIPENKGFSINKPVSLTLGSWKQQGYPFYGYGVNYSAVYNIDTEAHYAVQLNDWNGTVAEVSVNGIVAGIIGWKPYTLDVTKLMAQGENTVNVKIVGSFHNLLGPYGSYPAGIAHPGSWKNQPPYRAGKDYCSVDYGLFSPFSLCKYSIDNNRQDAEF